MVRQTEEDERFERFPIDALQHSASGITRLSNIGVPEKIRMMITGHASQGIYGQVYDRRERVPMKLLQEGLERLQYDEVLQALNNKDHREEATA
jgi:integrase